MAVRRYNSKKNIYMWPKIIFKIQLFKQILNIYWTYYTENNIFKVLTGLTPE